VTIWYFLDPFDPKKAGFCDLLGTQYRQVSKIVSVKFKLL
jgi:hypothetical protein